MIPMDEEAVILRALLASQGKSSNTLVIVVVLATTVTGARLLESGTNAWGLPVAALFQIIRRRTVASRGLTV